MSDLPTCDRCGSFLRNSPCCARAAALSAEGAGEPWGWACDNCIWYLSRSGSEHSGPGGCPDWHYAHGNEDWGRCEGTTIALYAREHPATPAGCAAREDDHWCTKPAGHDGEHYDNGTHNSWPSSRKQGRPHVHDSICEAGGCPGSARKQGRVEHCEGTDGGE